MLITGGTGFLGQHLAAEIFKRDLFDRVCIYSRDEYKQSKMDREDPRFRFFIGDVRDRDRLRRACHGVSNIIHAAALKRIEVGQYNPSEMVQTNITGAQNVVDVALDLGVKPLLISTDKACEPISPYGYTKALAESIFLAHDFPVVRYGNVASSTGSIIPVWTERVKNNLPLKVTDLDCTRFFMTIQQACDFVLNAKDHGLQVPALPAFSLRALVDAFLMKYGEFTIEVIGLPPWEKKHESMLPGQPSNEARQMSPEELLEHI